MTQKITHALRVPALRIATTAVLVLSLIVLGWTLNSTTHIDAPAMQPQSQYFTPKTMMLPPKVIIKVIKVPGPVRTVYVSRAKKRAPVGHGVVAFGRMLQGRGFVVSEHPAFGGVHQVHAVGSAHYSGNAIDVNWNNGNEYSHINAIVGLAKAYGLTYIWQSAGHYDHAHFANAVTSNTVKSVASNYSPPGGVAACIRKWESGGNYTAQNPSSTASGAYQFLDSTWQAVTGLSGRAMNYSPAIQDKAFYKLWNNGAGASQWVTSYHCV